MTSDRGWQFILFVGVLVIGAILYRHVQRDRPPFEAMKNVSPDGTEFVTPLVKDAGSAAKSESTELPERAAAKDAAASRQAWDQGHYEVSSEERGILIVSNGFERRTIAYSTIDVKRCRKEAAYCIYGPDFVAKVNAKLPEEFRPRGTNTFDARMNIGAPSQMMAPPPPQKRN